MDSRVGGRGPESTPVNIHGVFEFKNYKEPIFMIGDGKFWEISIIGTHHPFHSAKWLGQKTIVRFGKYHNNIEVEGTLTVNQKDHPTLGI
jgi:hypothetical protein